MQFKPNAQHNDTFLNCYFLFIESSGFVVFVKYFSVGFFNPNYLIQLCFILYIKLLHGNSNTSIPCAGTKHDNKHIHSHC